MSEFLGGGRARSRDNDRRYARNVKEEDLGDSRGQGPCWGRGSLRGGGNCPEHLGSGMGAASPLLGPRPQVKA